MRPQLLHNNGKNIDLRVSLPVWLKPPPLIGMSLTPSWKRLIAHQTCLSGGGARLLRTSQAAAHVYHVPLCRSLSATFSTISHESTWYKGVRGRRLSNKISTGAAWLFTRCPLMAVLVNTNQHHIVSFCPIFIIIIKFLMHLKSHIVKIRGWIFFPF